MCMSVYSLAMALADSVPGMRQGHTLRNAFFIVLAVFFAPVLVITVLAFLPLIAAVGVALDYRGAASRFDVLPGISSAGGVKAGAAAGVYVLVFFAVVGAGSGSGSDTNNAPTTTSSPTTAGLTTTVSTTSAPSTTLEAASATTQTATTTATPTTATATSATTATPTTAAVTSATTATATPTTATVTSATTATATPTTATATSATTATATPTTAAVTSATTATATPTTTQPRSATTTTTQTWTTTRETTTAATSTETTTGSQQTTYTVTVTEVVDGDTLDIQYANGTLDTVRLIGVDTPETYSENSPDEFEGIPDTSAGREWLGEWGLRASDYVRSAVEGETVTVVIDGEGDRRGYYGRLLGYVRVNASYQLNYALLENGYARVYDSEFSQSSRFYEAEATAQSNDVGLWGFEAETTTTTTGGSGAGKLEVVRIHEDAAGDEYENLNDEYVVFENTGGETLSVGGWTVYDEADHEYVFPSGFELEPGEQVTLHTGQGTDSETDLYWGMEAPVWNNNGDTVYVANDAGNLIIEESYA
jgi:micrococcal nuclease